MAVRPLHGATALLLVLGLLSFIEAQRRGYLFLSGCTQRAPAYAATTVPADPRHVEVAPCRGGVAHSQRQGWRRRRFLLDAAQLPRGLPGDPSEPLHLTFATSSVDELLSNWAAHMRKLRLPAVVSAMDSWVLERCPALRIHCLANLDAAMDDEMRKEAKRHGQRDASHVNIRGNPTLFISLGARKVAAILMLLEVSGRPVLVSDVDVVWMGDPRALVTGKVVGHEDFAHADVLASTDCLDPEMDERDHGCFHTLQDRNTGVLMVRNTTAGRAMMLEWKARTAGAFKAWETDQTAFDDLLRGRGRGHRRNMTGEQRREWLLKKIDWCGFKKGASESATMGDESDLGGRHTAGSRRLFDICVPFVARGLHFGLLPMPLIANGHSFFVQQLQLQGHPWPLAVHATYQFEDALDCAFGKRERMREWGLWLADSPEHMAAEVEGLSGRDDGTEDGGDDGDAGYGCEEEAAAARVEKPRTGEGGSSGGAAGTVASAPPIERFLVLEDNERGQIAPSVPLSSTPMLRVSLTDASALLGCVADGAAATKLLSQLFQMRWCWRPEEMTEPRYDAATNQTTDVCVWGFKTPGAPPQCA